jgi:hypothetical protein
VYPTLELVELRWVSLVEALELLPRMFGPVRDYLPDRPRGVLGAGRIRLTRPNQGLAGSQFVTLSWSHFHRTLFRARAALISSGTTFGIVQ